MKLLCKICNRVYGYKFPSSDKRVLKGICPDCEKASCDWSHKSNGRKKKFKKK